MKFRMFPCMFTYCHMFFHRRFYIPCVWNMFCTICSCICSYTLICVHVSSYFPWRGPKQNNCLASSSQLRFLSSGEPGLPRGNPLENNGEPWGLLCIPPAMGWRPLQTWSQEMPMYGHLGVALEKKYGAPEEKHMGSPDEKKCGVTEEKSMGSLPKESMRWCRLIYVYTVSRPFSWNFVCFHVC